ncbi:SSI family serine proteinase inhibitor [Streptomyces gilvus]|uniref:SSI family serine proteinase inhibitor n=1 Tax=Streptomyces gilvus TaxID=2920937 RepID=UPI001F10ECF0|nr:SSI family serine proteinase inhibitor [Streptomyces sp. CME 23]MCH5672377.1 subtilase-type protease inhibitor [Streptomyces sp. CME 23]
MTISTTAKAVRGALLAAALLLAAAPLAQAAPGHHLPGNWLYLTVTQGDSRADGTRGSLLLCDLPHRHARAARACADLAAVGGDIGALPARDVMCPMIYAPVTVHARGRWSGRAVEYAHTFPNRCAMRARTGEVFALDG